MKKLLITLMVVLGLEAKNYELTYNDLNYIYNYSNKKCEKQDYESKTFYLNKFRTGQILVDNKADTLPGYITSTVGNFNGKEYYHDFASTYGACLLFQEFIILGKEVDPKDYVNRVEK